VSNDVLTGYIFSNRTTGNFDISMYVVIFVPLMVFVVVNGKCVFVTKKKHPLKIYGET
jgi:hypothetical protein